MTHHEHISPKTETEKNKSLFFPGMIGIVDQKSTVIVKNSLCFLK